MPTTSYQCTKCERRRGADTAVAEPRLMNCQHCGLVQHVPALWPGKKAKPYARRDLTVRRYSNRNT